MRELIAAVGVVGVSAITACSVGDASAVARYPWIEHARVALVEERLSIEVHEGEVDVDAWFRFDGQGALPVRMIFPIGSGDGDLVTFAATMETEDAPPRALVVDGTSGSLGIELPPSHDVRRTRLRARYRQRATRSFRYVLKSGAYWAGPIGALQVVVRDPERRIASALVEGRAADRVEGDASYWSFVDLEPHDGVAVETN